MSKTPLRILWQLPLVLLCVIWSTPAFAINIRHDVADALYIAHGQQSQFSATGFLAVPGTDVSAVVIADGTWILTAAHAVDGGVVPGDVTLTINAANYSAAEIHLSPTDDLALVKLSTAVVGVTPAAIYTGSSELSAIGSLVGFGRTGTGHVGNTGSQGTLRGAENVVDAFVTTGGSITSVDGADRRSLFADFDAPAGYLDSGGLDPPNATGSSNPLALEGSLNTGDSGSPLFIQDGLNWYVVGIGVGVAVESDLYGGAHTSVDSRFSDYGDAVVWTRVSTSSSWILTTIPEPSSSGLLLLGIAGLLRMSRRGHRAKS